MEQNIGKKPHEAMSMASSFEKIPRKSSSNGGLSSKVDGGMMAKMGVTSEKKKMKTGLSGGNNPISSGNPVKSKLGSGTGSVIVKPNISASSNKGGNFKSDRVFSGFSSGGTTKPSKVDRVISSSGTTKTSKLERVNSSSGIAKPSKPDRVNSSSGISGKSKVFGRPTAAKKPLKANLIQLKSEVPFVIRIRKFSTIPRVAVPRPPPPPPVAPPQEALAGGRGRRIGVQKRRLPQSSSDDDDEHEFDASTSAITMTTAAEAGPPPGVLASLWYSRECAVHLLVVEKILWWKRRKKHKIPQESLERWGSRRHMRQRMEISRIPLPPTNQTQKEKPMKLVHETDRSVPDTALSPNNSPVVGDGVEGSQETPPKVEGDDKEEDEEVLLIKWRGRSYLHCSWERSNDLLRVDPSSKPKLRRFYAQQESVMGLQWKNLMTASYSDDEDYFSPDYTEVERILNCDETTMDMKIFEKQRALNEKVDEDPSLEPATKKSANAAWDPEDNVRYVVKWKGLPNSELSWEYWRDIKQDSVEEAIDYWKRRILPTNEELRAYVTRSHPSMAHYKKMTTSPRFGREAQREEEGDTETDSSGLYLRNYQLEGVNWLLFNWYNRRSCILADEMGLGKTIQSVGFLQKLCWSHSRGPFLVVAPLSLISQWQSESVAWAPNLNAIVYHGSADARSYIVKHEFYHKDDDPKNKGFCAKLKKMNWTKFHILITTYEVVLKDIAVLSRIKWRCLIVDEAHRLKNSKSRLFLELATLPRDFCLLLTGTPLQNSTEELWALLYFSDPKTFASKEQFVEKFGQLTDSKQVSDLHSILKPYLLRRVKEDVEKSLPPKEETILEVALTPIQKTYYKAIYEKNTNFLFKGSKPSNAPSLMNIMMELRKCCNHPFLIRGAEERILSDAVEAKRSESRACGDPQAAEVTPQPHELLAENLVNSSGKMVLLAKLLPKLQDGGHKVLVFSQMVRVLDLLEDLLRSKGYRFERLDGSTSASSRSAAVDRFCRPSFRRFVMLLSTRAGGLGLNLTAADTVVIYDSDWNPQNDLQAMARAHRIGQTRAVRVYRLLTRKTYEMHMFHSASLKLGLDRAVLAHQRNADDSSATGGSTEKTPKKAEKEIQAKEIDELLKKGAYDVFRDEEDDQESRKFMETDIDSLLERSSRTVTYGAGATSSIGSGLGSFSKASFVATTGDGEDIELDDPDFWSKALGLAEMSTENERDGTEPGKKRHRKQVQVFDPYAAFAEAEQRKQSKAMAKAREEKEEKERVRKEKKARRQEEKDKRKREREEAREAKDRPSSSSNSSEKDAKRPRIGDEDGIPKSSSSKSSSKSASSSGGKHSKSSTANSSGAAGDKAAVALAKTKSKAERRKMLRKIENEDPPIERLKQAWEVGHRNRAVCAILNFGLGRYCKVRQEANLTSLPIQDLEVFLRQFLFQVGLQASVSLMQKLRGSKNNDNLNNDDCFQSDAKNLFKSLIRIYGEHDGSWICQALHTSLDMHDQVRNRTKTLRMAPILTGTTFVGDLRDHGVALCALHRFAFLSRLTMAVEDALDRKLGELGHEELGKRGCPTKDLTTLDVDLKARHVTVEELSHSLAMVMGTSTSSLGRNGLGMSPCASLLPPWWDRSCDIALVIGTFIHGLGNYEAMQLDGCLPFGLKIGRYSLMDMFASQSIHNFEVATKRVRKVLEEWRIRQQASRSKVTESAHNTTTEGNTNEVATAKIGKEPASVDQTKPSTQKSRLSVDKDNGLSAANISEEMLASIRESPRSFLSTLEQCLKRRENFSRNASADGDDQDEEMMKRRKQSFLPYDQRLPMPDCKILDRHLLWLVDSLNCLGSLPPLVGDASCNNKVMDVQKTTSMNDTEIIRSVNALLASSEMELLGHGLFTDKSTIDSPRLGFFGTNEDDEFVPWSDRSHQIVAAIDSKMVDCGGLFVPTKLTRFGACALIHTSQEALDAVAAKLGSAGLPSTGAGGRKPLFLDCVSSVFRDRPLVRANMCIEILLNGLPRFESEKSFRKVNGSLWEALYGEDEGDVDDMDEGNDQEEDRTSSKEFLKPNQVHTCASDEYDLEAYEEYVKTALVPHCLHLCLNEVDCGVDQKISSIPRDNDVRCLIPDPCLPLEKHSDTAVKLAAALLRRVRLSKAIRYIAGGGVPWETISAFLKGPILRRNLTGLPIWWCPWIHDLGLLVYAATSGLFGVTRDRLKRRARFMDSRVFGGDALSHHIRTTFFEGRDGMKPVLARSFLQRFSHPSFRDRWIEVQSSQFPGPNRIERRLAFLCSELTTMAVTMNSQLRHAEWRYDNIPMFDHGSWPCMDPIDGQCTSNGIGLVQVNKSLLSTVEDEWNHETTA